MDIIILHPQGPHAELRLQFALRSLDHIEHENVYIVGEKPAIPVTAVSLVPLSGPRREAEVFSAIANIPGLSDQFIVMPDRCVVMERFVPLRYVNVGNLPRGEGDADRMRSTLNHLLRADLPTHDYELCMPMVFGKGAMMLLLENISSRSDMMIRTLYCNTYAKRHIRIKNPLIERWSHFDDPQLSVFALSDQCYEHIMCGRWLKRNLRDRSRYEEEAVTAE